MIKPALNELLRKVDCRYTLVSVISKRARQIVDEYAEQEDGLDDKAVVYAVDDLMLDRIDYEYAGEKNLQNDRLAL